MKEISKRIGLNIRMLRDGNELTLDELAAKIGVSRQMVWNWENHVNEPGGKNLSKLAGLFKVSTNFLKNNTAQIDTGTLALIKINRTEEDNKRIEEGSVFIPDEFYKDIKLLRDERDELKNKLLLQHEKYQSLNEKYEALKTEFDEYKAKKGA